MARIPKIWYRKERKAWFVTIRGARHNLGADKKVALERFHQLMGKPAHKTVQSQSFVAVADAFLEWLKSHRAEGSFRFYYYPLVRFCQQFPKLQLTEIRPFHCQQWIDLNPRISKTTRRNYLRAVRRCVNWAYRQGLLASDPLRELEMPSGNRREVFVTREQFTEMLSFIKEEWFRNFCVVAFETGCRPQEIRRVEVRHYDEANSRWIFPIDESKGKRQSRVVYLTPQAERITKDLIQKSPHGHVFCDGQGKFLSQHNLDAAFERLQRDMARRAMQTSGTTHEAEAAKELKRRGDTRSRKELSKVERCSVDSSVYAQFAPRYCTYVLRHSFATAALQSGIDAMTVGVLMGHRDPSMLGRVYQHLSHNASHLLGQIRKTVDG